MEVALRLIGRVSAVGLLAGVVCALFMPSAARAGGGHTPPPAVNFNLNIQATALSRSFAGSATGTADQNGDSEETFTFGGHTFGIVSAGGVVYQNEDGGSYKPVTSSHSSSDGGQTLGLAIDPSCVNAVTGLDTVFQQALGGQGAGSALGLQDLGPASINGQQAEHLQGTIDLGSATINPQVMQALNPLLAGCSGGSAQVLAFLPLVLPGANTAIDAYVDPATGVPLQFDLDTNIPAISGDFDVSGQMTPLSSPVPIAAPS